MSAALAILPKVWACQSLHEVAKPAAPQPEPEQQQPEPEQTVTPSLAFYRKYTEAMLRRYMRLSMEIGRAPSLLGREMFRGRVTSCRVTGFDDVVIFVHDVERCIAKLNGIQQRFVIRIAVQEYTQNETAAMMRLSRRDVVRQYNQAIDRLTAIFLEVHLLEPLKACQGGGSSMQPVNS